MVRVSSLFFWEFGNSLILCKLGACLDAAQVQQVAKVLEAGHILPHVAVHLRYRVQYRMQYRSRYRVGRRTACWSTLRSGVWIKWIGC